eukprot:1156449-Pelagomonas_calceolata.AAC.2
MLLRANCAAGLGCKASSGKTPAAAPANVAGFTAQHSACFGKASSSTRNHHHVITPLLPSCPAPLMPQAAHSSAICRAVVAPAETEAGGAPFQRGSGWALHKFGGTCMAAAERIAGASKLMIDINPDAEGKVAVVSAMGSHPTSPLKPRYPSPKQHAGRPAFAGTMWLSIHLHARSGGAGSGGRNHNSSFLQAANASK